MNRGFEYPFKTGTIAINNGVRVNYIDEGEGAHTLIFIHGLANYAMVWQKNIPELRKQFRCVAIDLPGSGLSDMPDTACGISYFTDTLFSVIEGLGLKNVVLVGHSMGGQIAIAMALKYPSVVGKMVLCAPAGLEYFSSFETGLYKSTLNFFDYFSSEENSLARLIRSSFYRDTHQGDDMISDLVKLMRLQPAGQYRKIVDGCINGMLHEPVYNSLHLIHCPTLILFGERDSLIPNRMLHPITTRKLAEDSASKIPKASLQMIADCGHFVQWEKAGEVNRLVAAFAV
jgi:pimeloyl-ACP methyl ester carboxylesterase